MSKQYFLNCGVWDCQIVPDFGANVVALRYDGDPILREPANMAALQSTPVLYGIPLLLPPNRTAGGRFTFEGKAYQLPVNETLHGNHLHGLLHSAPFQVVEQKSQCLKTRLVNRGKLFPFPFQIEITDFLDPTGFHRMVEIENIGDSAMPLTLGFHTSFTEPEWFSAPIGKHWVTNQAHIPTGELEALSADQLDYRIGCDPRNRSISGFYTADAGTAQIGRYIFKTEGFDQWILYNGGGSQGYLCVEPQFCPVNSLAAGRCGRLGPGEKASFRLHITKA